MVVFLHGPPAVGKRTVGVVLAERIGLPLFHNHLAVDLALSLFPFGSPGFRALRATTWLTAFEEATRAGRDFIFTFSPEATVDPGLIDALVRAASGQVHFVSLTCEAGALRGRVSGEDRQQFGKLTDPELYDRLVEAKAFAFPDLPAPLLEVDTTRSPPAETVTAIVEALQGVGAL